MGTQICSCSQMNARRDPAANDIQLYSGLSSEVIHRDAPFGCHLQDLLDWAQPLYHLASRLTPLSFNVNYVYIWEPI